MSNQLTDILLMALEAAAKAATPGPHHVYTHPRDDNNHDANDWFHRNCFPQYVLELIDRVRKAEALAAAKVVELTDNSMLMVTFEKGVSQCEAVEQLIHMRKLIPLSAPIVGIRHGTSLTDLSGEDLAKLGLMRLTDQIAWMATTVGYRKYITDAQYQKLQPSFQQWYKPYRCSQCEAKS